MPDHNTRFRSLHPNHCIRCNGWGGHLCPGELVPYGSTSARLPDEWDECPSCVGQGLCPWCGSELKEIQVKVAKTPIFPGCILPFLACSNESCGWNEHDGPDGLEPEPEPNDDWEEY